MALDLSSINQNVNDNLSTETPTNPAALAVPSNDDLAGQLAAAVQEIEALKSQRALEETERAARLSKWNDSKSRLVSRSSAEARSVVPPKT
jgi:hypothetical protein